MDQKRKQLWIAAGLAHLLVLGSFKAQVCSCAVGYHDGSTMASARHAGAGHCHPVHRRMAAGHHPEMAPSTEAPGREAPGRERHVGEQGRGCEGGECRCASMSRVDYYPEKAPGPPLHLDSSHPVHQGAIDWNLDPPSARGSLAKACGPPPGQRGPPIFVVNCAFLL